MLNRTINPAFGQRLREYRLVAGMTQQQVADAVGIHHTYLSRIECGHDFAPSEDTIHRILAVIGASPVVRDELLVAAGKIPTDVQTLILAHPDACALLRSRYPARPGTFAPVECLIDDLREAAYDFGWQDAKIGKEEQPARELRVLGIRRDLLTAVRGTADAS